MTRILWFLAPNFTARWMLNRAFKQRARELGLPWKEVRDQVLSDILECSRAEVKYRPAAHD